MDNKKIILVINPGSTSTKVALYNGECEINNKSIEHSSEIITRFANINEQLNFRKEAVISYLKEMNVAVSELSAIAARGGVIGELETGAYLVDKDFVEASKKPLAPHVSNLAPIIAFELANEVGINAYAYDMVCGCGTPEEIFTLSGVPELSRPFLTHVLNSRATCFEQASRDNLNISEATYIVTHMGGGITSNLVDAGKIKDIVADDEGTMSPERSGGVPSRRLVELCFSGKYSEKQVQTMLKGKGGMVAYLGTNDLKEVEERIENGDKKALLICEAMAMQISKDIGSLATVVEGKVDKIILTGGMAYSKRLTDMIGRRTSFIAPISIMAGTFEMKALALGVLRVLNGQEKAHRFKLVLQCIPTSAANIVLMSNNKSSQ